MSSLTGQELAKQIVQIICLIYPAKGNMEVMVLTYERYTGAYHGSWMSVVAAGDNSVGCNYIKNISSQTLYYRRRSGYRTQTCTVRRWGLF